MTNTILRISIKKSYYLSDKNKNNENKCIFIIYQRVY